MPDVRWRQDALVAGVVAALAAGAFFFSRDLPFTLRLDNELVHFPMTLEAYRRWTAGEIPAWSDGLWSGFPLLADPVTAGFYPLHLLAFLVTPEPHLRAFDLATALHAGVLVAGVVAVLGALGAGREARVLGALLAFLGAQFHWWACGFLPSFAALAWWPWGVLAAERLAAPAAAVGPIALLGSAALAAQALAGYPEFALYGGSLAVLWLVTRGTGVPLARRLARAVFLVAPALMLAAAQVLPSALEVHDTVRATRSVWAFLDAAPMALAPFLDPLDGYFARPFFLGAATIALAAAGLWRRAPRGVFLALVAVGSVVVALGAATPAYGLLVRLPLFRLFRGPAKFLDLTELVLVWLAALGFERLRASPRGAVRVLALALALGAVGERAVYTCGRFASSYVPLGPLERPLDFLLATLREDVAPFAQATEEHGVPPRVYFEAWPHRYGNLPMLYGVESAAGGVTALLSPRHGKLLRPPIERVLYDVAGVRLVFVPGRCPSGIPLVKRELTVVHAGAYGCLLQNPHAPRRYDFLRAARATASMNDMVTLVHDSPRGAVPVWGPPEEIARRTAPAETPGGIRVLASRPGDVTLATTAVRDGLLLVRESWKPGWEAQVDGAPLPVWPAASIFFAVPVPGGSHVVRLRYRQPGLAPGLGLAAGWLALAAVVAVRRRRATRG